MKHIALYILACIALLSVAAKASGGSLELYAFIAESPEGKTSLCLRITNRGDAPQTILTEGYSLSATKVNGHRSPFILLDYRLLTMGPADDPERWKFIPSLPKLAPVRINKGETASLHVTLDDELIAAIRKPNTIVTIQYQVAEDIAQRFGLWTGKLELCETSSSLRNK